jgi:hypothetical protein
MARWQITYVSRDAMLGHVPAIDTTFETDAETDGLDEQAIVDMLHHLTGEHTDWAGVLTEAVELDENGVLLVDKKYPQAGNAS